MDPRRAARIEDARDHLARANLMRAWLTQPPAAYGLDGDCEGCGGPLPPQRYRGNPRVWCSEACRHYAYRQNRRSS